MDAVLAETEEFKEPDEDFGYWHVNLHPRTTGLPMVVWIGPRMGARHDVRVKVSRKHGDRVMPLDLAVMSVRPEPQLLHGELSSADRQAVARWIKLNEQAILDHWNEVTDGIELGAALRRLDP